MAGGFGGGEPPVGAEQVEVVAAQAVAEIALQRRHVTGDDGTDVRVGDGGNGALVLLHLRDHFGGEGNGHAGHLLFGDRLNAALMPAVGVSIDQRDGKRLDATRFELTKLGAEVVLVQGLDDIAAGAEALLRFDRQLERSQRRTLVVDHPGAETAGDEGAGHLQHLSITLCGYEADAGATAGEDGVGRDGGAVHDLADCPWRDAGLLANFLQPLQDASGEIRGSGGNLRDVPGTAVFVNEKKVREGSTHVDTDSEGHASLLSGTNGNLACCGRVSTEACPNRLACAAA